MDAFICDGLRMPIARFGGVLSPMHADALVAHPVRALLARRAFGPAAMEEGGPGDVGQSLVRHAVAAGAGGVEGESAPVEISQRKGPELIFDRNADTPARLRGGNGLDLTVTAGQDSGVNAEAAAHIASGEALRQQDLTPMPRLDGTVSVGRTIAEMGVIAFSESLAPRASVGGSRARPARRCPPSERPRRRHRDGPAAGHVGRAALSRGAATVLEWS
ncbi:hypothetical protein [Jannaschia seohaensis]|uniref:Uncharacterized protein n=1 Tax=Jannaschia seohaensis TaxID=475081 RepID=A0A2Y9A1B9_9RHOB|nr:hypothetical protein [Jannaschia seohaensis]PWJ21916.1 hypothetical protein BCF38_101325 [Jannaschia seohaensis]SSA38194.1 hypothetical protein SAMN05421539_101325 [Jannaschia seohaensis]